MQFISKWIESIKQHQQNDNAIITEPAPIHIHVDMSNQMEAAERQSYICLGESVGAIHIHVGQTNKTAPAD